MKKTSVKVGVVMLLISAFGFNSCIGSFNLTHRLLSWNNSIGNKIVNELVFFAFLILPVYEVSYLADLLVINSIEFWSGSNPLAQGTKKIEGTDGQIYLVKCDGKGYDIYPESNPSAAVRLDFQTDAQRWDVTTPAGETFELMTMIDADHVSLPAADGTRTTVELSEAGLMAYQQQALGAQFAAL